MRFKAYSKLCVLVVVLNTALVVNLYGRIVPSPLSSHKKYQKASRAYQTQVPVNIIVHAQRTNRDSSESNSKGDPYAKIRFGDIDPDDYLDDDGFNIFDDDIDIEQYGDGDGDGYGDGDEGEEDSDAEKGSSKRQRKRQQGKEKVKQKNRSNDLRAHGNDDEPDLEGDFHMDDFSPSHVLSFLVKGRERECFYEDLIHAASGTKDGAANNNDHKSGQDKRRGGEDNNNNNNDNNNNNPLDPPVKLRGAYFVSADSGSLEIEFEVVLLQGPAMSVELPYFRDPPKDEGVFHVQADTEGTYAFCFKNPHASPRTVTFALHVGTSTRDNAKTRDFTPLEQSVRSADRHLQEIVAEENFFALRLKRHLAVQDSTSWRVAAYTILESLFMVAMVYIQTLYVQRLVDSRNPPRAFARSWV